jgi:hypothetical protein
MPNHAMKADRHAYHCNNRIFPVNSKPAGVLAMIYSLCLFTARLVLNNVTSALFWSVYWEFLLTPLSVVGDICLAGPLGYSCSQSLGSVTNADQLSFLVFTLS